MPNTCRPPAPRSACDRESERLRSNGPDTPLRSVQRLTCHASSIRQWKFCTDHVAYPEPDPFAPSSQGVPGGLVKLDKRNSLRSNVVQSRLRLSRCSARLQFITFIRAGTGRNSGTGLILYSVAKKRQNFAPNPKELRQCKNRGTLLAATGWRARRQRRS